MIITLISMIIQLMRMIIYSPINSEQAKAFYIYARMILLK